MKKIWYAYHREIREDVLRADQKRDVVQRTGRWKLYHKAAMKNDEPRRVFPE